MDRIERVELPNQIISALEDPLLQKYIAVKDDATHRRRIDGWLSLVLDAQLSEAIEDGQSSQFPADFLQGVLNYTKYAKVLDTLYPQMESILIKNRLSQLLS